ncbi:MAG: tryptophan-rich sensory protein [Chlamydiales bacterium]|nr:tryptophan-rich sensory protein [Chlamydiia bacterium]MCP5504887.1 tryptophan-rich sensory protein [Chlamydiales bacterium]
MYTRKQKVEIFIIFLLIVIAMELFSFMISEKGLVQLYNANEENLPWIMPVRFMIPIWTVLYLLMGISGALIWIKRATHIRNFAMWAWIIQLLLNVLWPICFFYIPLPILTPVLITLLFMTLIILMFYSYLISRLATILLIPYFLMIIYKLLFGWVFFILDIRILK